MDYNYSLYNQIAFDPVCYENESPNLLWNIFYIWSLISIQFGVTTFVFIWVDKYISPKEGGYYFVHSLCNFFVVIFSINDVISLYYDPYSGLFPTTNIPVVMTYSLHFYHIILYHEKFRFDDWLHHILMIFISLPLGNYFGTSSRLLSHSLFYTTGLPGMIDYACLTLVRNGLLSRNREKQINRYLNIWLRCPGCVIHAFLTFIMIQQLSSTIDVIVAFITMVLVYWNGVYFMDQVVGNYYLVINNVN